MDTIFLLSTKILPFFFFFWREKEHYKNRIEWISQNVGKDMVYISVTIVKIG